MSLARSHYFSFSRFILNLPDHELGSLERVSFQVEQAYDPHPRYLLNLTDVHLSAIGFMKTSLEMKIQNYQHCL
jgi:Dcp2, box A domain